MGVSEMRETEWLSAKVKIRYHHPAQTATCEMLTDGVLRICFHEPVRAAAPGQSAVAYDGAGRVLFGGVIQKS